MNKDLMSIITAYATKSYDNYSAEVSNKSKEKVNTLFTDLLSMYFNDLNSSTLREIVTVEIAGYQHIGTKIGYDGYKILDDNGEDTHKEKEYCEAKPKNLIISDDEKKNKSDKKLSGQGNFTDFTWSRFNKIINDDIKMVISGFINGRLLFVLSFDFNEPEFKFHLRSQLQKRFSEGKDIEGQFLRSATFNYKYYKNAKTLKIDYLIDNINEYSKYLVNDFYNLLIEKNRNSKWN